MKESLRSEGIEILDKMIRELIDQKDKEIERLKKEKEWLLTSFAQMYKDEYSGIDESIDDIKKNACLQMDKELKQELKEKK